MQRGKRMKRSVLVLGLLSLLLIGCGKTGSRAFSSVEVMKNEVLGMYRMDSGDAQFIMEITGDDKINIYAEDASGKSKNLGTYTVTWNPKNGSLLMKGETLEKEIFVLDNGAIQNEGNTYVRIEDDDAESTVEKDEGSESAMEKDEEPDSVPEQVKGLKSWMAGPTGSISANESESVTKDRLANNSKKGTTREYKNEEYADNTKEEVSTSSNSFDAESYLVGLKDMRKQILNGASDAEYCANLICDVWHNAIYKTRDKNTDKYVFEKGDYNPNDFEDALKCLFSEKRFANRIDIINDLSEVIRMRMKAVMNYPESCQNAFSAMEKLYEDYMVLARLATNPSGNYQSY